MLGMGAFDWKAGVKGDGGWGGIRRPDFDDKVIPMHALGMTTREIRHHVEVMDGVTVSVVLVSKITDAVRWRRFGSGSRRPLEEVCAIAFETKLRQLALFMIST